MDTQRVDPALQPPAVLTAPGAPYTDADRRWQGIPGIERAPGGRLWATWYSGGAGEGPFNYVVLVTSADDGKTWSAPKLAVDPPGFVRAFDPCLWRDPEGRLWLFWAQAVGLWDGRAGVWAVTCADPDAENPAWSAPRRLCDGIMMNKPVVLSTGEWLLPVAVWSWGSLVPKVNDSLRLGLLPEEVAALGHDVKETRGSHVVVSADRGRTWKLRGGARLPQTNCDEHMVVERRDGSLWMLVRTAYGIGESVSTDGGRTWSAGGPSGIPHPVTRFFLRRLASGALLMVRHAPEAGKRRSHLAAYVSDDDGRTWQGGLMVDERPEVSYPDGVQAEDGRVYVIYDRSRHDEKEILMAVFTEADVRAGRCISPEARLRVPVNKVPLVLRDNADGEALGAPLAVLAPAAEGEADTARAGAILFTNRAYTFEELPEALVGKRFLRASIDGAEAVCRAPGYVCVLTPSEGRNPDSLEQDLLGRGFRRTRVPEFRLFGTHANLCSTFQKRVEEGERVRVGKWGVLLFGP